MHVVISGYSTTKFILAADTLGIILTDGPAVFMDLSGNFCFLLKRRPSQSETNIQHFCSRYRYSINMCNAIGFVDVFYFGDQNWVYGLYMINSQGYLNLYDVAKVNNIRLLQNYTFNPEDSPTSLSYVADRKLLMIGFQYSTVFFEVGSIDNRVDTLAEGRISYYVNYLVGTNSFIPFRKDAILAVSATSSVVNILDFDTKTIIASLNMLSFGRSGFIADGKHLYVTTANGLYMFQLVDNLVDSISLGYLPMPGNAE